MFTLIVQLVCSIIPIVYAWAFLTVTAGHNPRAFAAKGALIFGSASWIAAPIFEYFRLSTWEPFAYALSGSVIQIFVVAMAWVSRNERSKSTNPPLERVIYSLVGPMLSFCWCLTVALIAGRLGRSLLGGEEWKIAGFQSAASIFLVMVALGYVLTWHPMNVQEIILSGNTTRDEQELF